jgi:hypothetical protein
MAQQTFTYNVEDARTYLREMDIDPTDEEVISLIESWAEEEFGWGNYTLLGPDGWRGTGMSAWIVSKRHIDALVYWADMLGVSKADKTNMGKMLWKENHRSINYRYGERGRTPSYRWSKPFASTQRHYDDYDPESMDQALHLVRCYDYQTCETADYWQTPAGRLIVKLETALMRMGADPKRDGAKPPWGI